jgi:hypothetical protein
MSCHGPRLHERGMVKARARFSGVRTPRGISTPHVEGLAKAYAVNQSAVGFCVPLSRTTTARYGRGTNGIALPNTDRTKTPGRPN